MNEIEDFLQYSLKREKKIYLIFTDDSGKMVKRMMQILAILPDGVIQAMTGRKKLELTMDRIFAAAYARGDSGDLESV